MTEIEAPPKSAFTAGEFSAMLGNVTESNPDALQITPIELAIDHDPGAMWMEIARLIQRADLIDERLAMLSGQMQELSAAIKKENDG